MVDLFSVRCNSRLYCRLVHRKANASNRLGSPSGDLCVGHCCLGDFVLEEHSGYGIARRQSAWVSAADYHPSLSRSAWRSALAIGIAAMRQWIAIIAIAALPTTAEACTVFSSAPERVARAYSTNVVRAVVLVRGDQASYVGLHPGHARPWRALATASRVLQGDHSDSQFTFGGGGGSSACDLGYTLPTPGDEWVVYVYADDGRVLHAFPADVAQEVDPNLRQ